MSKGKKLLSIAGRFLKGALDGSTFGVASAVASAKESSDGGQGKHDYPKITGYLIMGFIIFGVIFKNLSPDVAEDLMKLLVRFGFLG